MSYYDAKIHLLASDEELITSFNKLKNFNDVCDILEVTPVHLRYILFIQKKSKQYYKFEIPKKSSGVREILAPNPSLKILQQKLNYIMTLIYKPKYSVHGYVKEKSIVTNAKQHLNKNYVLNFDIENFFPSINFGRVRGILKSFFGIGDDSATVIANICCFNNSLPQGAPTSPILSNMICFQLDRELQNLAKRSSCVYTRYADDITFSTTKKEFPKQIAYMEDTKVHLGKSIYKILEKNGFKVNQKKTRLHNKYQQLSVTGIKVNEKLNVDRNYIKKIRAMLRSLELNTSEEAQKLFQTKYHRKSIKNMESPSVLNVVNGMINYVGMVRGFDDDIFGKLAHRYNKIAGINIFNIKNRHSDLWESSIYVVEVGYKDEEGFYPEEQGTGFLLNGVGLVTNAHVVQKFDIECNAVYVHQSRYDNKNVLANIIAIDKERDIAILDVPVNGNSQGFIYNVSHEIGQHITLLGYPNFGDGDSLYRDTGQIVQYRSHFMANKINPETGDLGVKQERIVISPRIVTGNSGGPVVNSENEVIGIATKGFKEVSPGKNDDDTATSMIVKIQDVIEFASEQQKKKNIEVKDKLEAVN